MADEIKFGYKSGITTLTYGAYEPDGTVRTAAATALTEEASTGYYKADDASVVIGDMIIVKNGISTVGQGQYEAPVDTTVVLSSIGLDNIPATLPSGKATTFREMLVQTWSRFFNKAVKNTSDGTIKTYDASDVEVTSQTFTEAATLETVNKA